MKKIIVLVSVLAVAVLAFGVVSPALAAGSQRGGPGNGDPAGMGMSGSGRRGGFGDSDGIPLNRNIQVDGQLEDVIHENLAEALGISLPEMEDLLASGETVSDIAISLGYDLNEFRELMDLARIDALSEAVELGTLNQEQADWLASRWTGKSGSQFGSSGSQYGGSGNQYGGNCPLD